MTEAGALLARGKITHSYPHSWRSRAPLIFRATPQWFVRMDGPEHIREKALAAIDATHFVPDQGRNRIGSMVATRPDWCISRQRAWGVPIAVFVEKRTGEPLRDPAVVAAYRRGLHRRRRGRLVCLAAVALSRRRIATRTTTSRSWTSSMSGSSPARPTPSCWRPADLPWPADLYLEGSDQHRGWFQSSLLEAVGTRGRAPFKAVLTRRLRDGRARAARCPNRWATSSPRRRSRSKFGVDILRLWVMMSDTTEDLRIGPEILKQQAELYRRLRNTLRWVLGSLDGFSEEERVPLEEMPELERWVLHRLTEIDAKIRAAVASLRLDRRLSGAAQFLRHRSVGVLFRHPQGRGLLRPAGQSAPPRRAHRAGSSASLPVHVARAGAVLHRRGSLERPLRRGRSACIWNCSRRCRTRGTTTRWRRSGTRLRAIRRRITVPIEEARKANIIGSSLQAAVELPLNAEHEHLLDEAAWAEIAIVSSVRIVPGTDETLVEGHARVRRQMRPLLAGSARGGIERYPPGPVPALHGRGGVGAGVQAGGMNRPGFMRLA